jgi:hypothetical protein
MRSVNQDGTIELLVQFTNGSNTPIDPDSGPIISIFDPEHNPSDDDITDADAVVLDATTVALGTGLQVGNYLVEHLSTGLYRYQFGLDPESLTGSWFDRWEAVVDGAPLETIFTFNVIEKTNMESIQLQNNMEILVTLDSSIADADGNTLEEDYTILFSTELTPFYASADLLSLEIGSFLGDVPAYTLDLALHWGSIDANANTFRPKGSGLSKNNQYFEFARTQYVLCRAAHILIANASNTSVKSKKLADLEVEYDNSIGSKLEELMSKCAEWRKILNSGGLLTPGTSLPLTQGIKGYGLTDYPNFGRDWVQLPNVRGGANKKTKFKGSTRHKSHWETLTIKGTTSTRNSSED